MKQQLLLLDDVDALGRKGEVVTARPGYVRNFLLPRGLAVVATPHTLRKQKSLREEREKQAAIDRQESEALAQKLEGITLEIKVKVDPEGHMYGSVSAQDIAGLFAEQGLAIEKKYILLPRPLKATGMQKISLKLKEGISVVCQLNILPEGGIVVGAQAVTAPIPTEESPDATE
jgi:large subunit ribosomal protein L9